LKNTSRNAYESVRGKSLKDELVRKLPKLREENVFISAGWPPSFPAAFRGLLLPSPRKFLKKSSTLAKPLKVPSDPMVVIPPPPPPVVALGGCCGGGGRPELVWRG
jgi:hypothetical protein